MPDVPAVRLEAVSVHHRGSRRTGPVRALHEVSLEVRRGEVVAVCGRNGAGKTSLLDVVTAFRPPAAGTVRVLGDDPRRAGAGHRARVGVALADGGLPPAATPRRLLAHLARLFAAPEPVGGLIEATGLAGVADRPLRRVSSGERQRTALACALVGRPDVLVLDEPTAALDTGGRRMVLDVLAAARARGAAVLWTSHTLVDVDRASDRVAVLDAGRVVAAGTPGELAGSTDVVRFDAAPARDTAGLVAALPGGLAVRESTPGRYEVSGEGVDAAVLATVSTWQAANLGTGRLSVGPRGLEDVVEALTGTGPR